MKVNNVDYIEYFDGYTRFLSILGYQYVLGKDVSNTYLPNRLKAG